jgi:hypothetical protein
VRATTTRAPIASRRPITEQKIHTGKKEPKMLYSGAWEQPTKTSCAAGRPHIWRILVLIVRSTRTLRSFRARYGTATKPVPAVLIPGVGRSLHSLSLTSRLSHRVKDRIYWTKVSINTFVSDGHAGVADPRGMKPSFGFVSGRDFSRAVEAQERSGLKSGSLHYASTARRDRSLRPHGTPGQAG